MFTVSSTLRYMSSSYRSNRLGLSHWDPYAVHRGGCLELYYCNMVEWFWWDSSLISTTNWFNRFQKQPTNQPTYHIVVGCFSFSFSLYLGRIYLNLSAHYCRIFFSVLPIQCFYAFIKLCFAFCLCDFFGKFFRTLSIRSWHCQTNSTWFCRLPDKSRSDAIISLWFFDNYH